MPQSTAGRWPAARPPPSTGGKPYFSASAFPTSFRLNAGDADLVTKLIGATAEQGLLVTASGGTAIRRLFPYWADETVLGEAWERLGKAVASVS